MSLVIALLAAAAVLTALIVLAGWRSGKTLSGWLELLIVPLTLAVVGFAFTAVQSARDNQREDRRVKTDRTLADRRTKDDRSLADRRAAAERALAEDRQREEALRTYLRQMSDLLLQRHLASSHRGAEQWVLASTLTLTVLRRLDGERKGIVLRFIDDANLITGHDPKLRLMLRTFATRSSTVPTSGLRT